MDIIGQFSGGVKSFISPPSCVIDNHVFRFHYRASALILFTFSLLVTARQYFGDPIDCISKDDIPPNLLDTFCWIHTTFSLEHAWNKTVGVEVPYPGVDKYSPGEKRIYHAYYQWVCFVLFFQAILFLVPHKIWKTIENGRLKAIRLSLGNPIINDDVREKEVKIVIQYFENYRHTHNASFYAYVVTEILNFLNVIIQMIAMDRFLGGQFSTYGWQVLQFTEWDWSVRYDPMIKVFPRLTKCTFHRYGSSGDVQKHDAMCILPINIINEKIYIFLWFWFYFLAVMSLLTLIYRLVTIMSKRFRAHLIEKRCIANLRKECKVLVDKSDVGDWFLIHLLGKNIQPTCYAKFVEEYSIQLNSKKDNSA